MKLPYLFTLAGEEPFALAGIWDPAMDNLPETYCLLTTQPNELVARVHDRMPVILGADNYDLWLDPGMTNVEAVSEMLKPCDARTMRCYPVSSRVNHVGKDDEQCSVRVELTHPQTLLFF